MTAVEIVAKTKDFLVSNRPQDMLMLLKAKGPMFAHKDGKWTWPRFDSEFAKLCRKPINIGILNKTLFNLDFDNKELADVWEAKYAELQTAPKQQTKNGFHYILGRTELCNVLGLFDGARQFFAEDGSKLDLDIKTVCRTGTAGVLVVAPSKGKEWIRPIWETPIQPISDDFARTLSSMTKTTRTQHVATSSSAGTAGPVAEQPGGSATEMETPETVYKLLELVHPDRWKNYSDWRDIAMMLDHEAGDKYDEAFIKFSRTCPDKFNLQQCKAFLSKIHLRQFDGVPQTIASLHALAKQDSPDTYAELCLGGVKEKLDECVLTKGAPFRMAELFVLKYGDIIRCVSAKKQAFYAFANHRWMASGISKLSNMLSREIYMLFVDLSKRIGQQVAVETNEDHKRRLEDRRSAANQVAGQLLNTRFKASIITEIAHLLYQPDFFQILDTKPELLCFENGVFDVLQNQFRKGHPEDNLSVSCGYEYSAVDDKPVQDEIMSFIASCFETAEKTQYFLDITSSSLYGFRRFEEFYILTGSGGNGKGACTELLKASLGEYFATISSAFFTKPFLSASQATPELADKKAVRLLMTSEPETSEKLQISKLKLVSGGDDITARALYEAPFTYKPQFGIFIQANDIPALNKLDGGIQRRLRILHYPFQFCAKPSQPHEKLGDPRIKEEKVYLLSWKQQFMRILLENFEQRVKTVDSLSIPQNVQAASTEYLDSNNRVKEWIDEFYILTGNRTDAYKSKALYDHYRGNTRSECLSIQEWTQQMTFSGVASKLVNGTKFFIGIKLAD